MHGGQFVGGQMTGTDRYAGFSAPNGMPALQLHENVVAVPLGRALTVQSLGSVTVTDNHFSSQSIVPGFTANFLAASVLIFSFNTSGNVREEPVGYNNVKNGNVKVMKMQSSGTQSQYATPPNAPPVDTGANVSGGRQFELMRRSLGGAVHFADNRCELLNRSTERVLISALSAVLIVSLDDVSFLGNRVECSLVENRLLVDTFLFGLTVRANDNYWQENFGGALLSAVTFGILNTTTDNHSTHCVLVRGALYLNRHNLSLFALSQGYAGNVSKIDEINPCEERTRNLFGSFGQMAQQPSGQTPNTPGGPVTQPVG
jgi:hypothetical protein